MQEEEDDGDISAKKVEYERFLKAFGARIRVLRKQRGWTWRDMVVLHDLHLSKWQTFESGRYGFTFRSLLLISQIFKISLSELLAGLEQDVAAMASTPAAAIPPEPPSAPEAQVPPSGTKSAAKRTAPKKRHAPKSDKA